MKIVIWIKSVSKGRNSYWLFFKAYAGVFSNTTVYPIDFCATELHTSIPLSDSETEELKELLVADFGYPPYDIDKAKLLIGRAGKGYTIKRRRDIIQRL